MKFSIAPAVEAYWLDYHGYAEQQLGYYPARKNKTLFVTDEDGVFLVGVQLVDTDSGYLVVDGYVRNPEIDANVIYNATLFAQFELKKLASIINKALFILVTHTGLKKLLVGEGFTASQAELLFYSPIGVQVRPEYQINETETAPESPKPQEKPKKRRGRPPKKKAEDIDI